MANHDATSEKFSPSDVFFTITFLLFLSLAPWFYGLKTFLYQQATQLFIFIAFFLSLGKIPQISFQIRVEKIGFWVLLSVGLAFLYCLISSVPSRSWVIFLAYSSIAAFYAMIKGVVKTDRQLQIFLWGILLIGLFYSVYGLAQYYGFIGHDFWYQLNSLSSRYINSGHFAAFLLFPLFINIAFLVLPRHWAIKSLLFLSFLIMSWTFVLTRSRAGWMVFCFGGILFIFFLKNHPFPKKAKLGLIFFLVITVVAFFALGGAQHVLARFAELRDAHYFSLIQRLNLWRISLKAIAARPWGWGLGTFILVFPQFRDYSERFLIDYAHNEFLQIGVDHGLLGIALAGLFVFFYFKSALVFLKRNEISFEQKVYGAAFLAVAVSLFMTSQVDFPLRVYANSLFFAAFLAMQSFLFESDGPPRAVPSGNKMVFRTGIYVITLVAIFVTAGQVLAEIHFRRAGSFEKDSAKNAAALGEYEKAIAFAPLNAGYYESLGALYQKKSWVARTPDEKNKLREKAVKSYQQAVRVQPFDDTAHYALALLYETSSRLELAKAEFLEVMHLNPYNEFFILQYGYFAVRHGMTQVAIETFEKFKNTHSYLEDPKADPCKILQACFGLTQNFEDLKRVVPDTWKGRYCFGQFLGAKGQWDLAKTQFNKALEGEKRTHNSEEYLRYFSDPVASFYISNHRIHEAIEIYEKALIQKPDDIESQKKMSELNQLLLQTKGIS